MPKKKEKLNAKFKPSIQNKQELKCKESIKYFNQEFQYNKHF
jgi:hypothetical protein